MKIDITTLLVLVNTVSILMGIEALVSKIKKPVPLKKDKKLLASGILFAATVVGLLIFGENSF